MVLGGDREKIEPYLRLLADLIGLRNWEIFVSDKPPANPRHGATCSCYYGRKRAEISFDEAWTSWSREDFRSTCVHELLHCHFRPMEEPVQNLKSVLGEVPYNLTSMTFNDALEYTVDGIATEWAKTLPLPVKVKKKRKEEKA